MLRSTSILQRLTILAEDGEIGSVDRLFFDDEHWTVRHIVVDTGKWLPGRKVLISPSAVTGINDDGATMSVRLTKHKVRNSPDVDTDKPVSRQKEIELARYYGYVPYWGTGGLWGGTYYPPAAVTPPFGMVGPQAVPEDPERQSGAPDAPPEPVEEHGDPHLRSTREVKGYHVRATDESIGHVEDFLVDDASWAITHLVIDSSNWPGGRTLAIPPNWVSRVDWGTMKIFLAVPVATVRQSPEVDTQVPVTPEQERVLRDQRSGRAE